MIENLRNQFHIDDSSFPAVPDTSTTNPTSPSPSTTVISRWMNRLIQQIDDELDKSMENSLACSQRTSLVRSTSSFSFYFFVHQGEKDSRRTVVIPAETINWLSVGKCLSECCSLSCVGHLAIEMLPRLNCYYDEHGVDRSIFLPASFIISFWSSSRDSLVLRTFHCLSLIPHRSSDEQEHPRQSFVVFNIFNDQCRSSSSVLVDSTNTSQRARRLLEQQSPNSSSTASLFIHCSNTLVFSPPNVSSSLPIFVVVPVHEIDSRRREGFSVLKWLRSTLCWFCRFLSPMHHQTRLSSDRARDFSTFSSVEWIFDLFYWVHLTMSDLMTLLAAVFHRVTSDPSSTTNDRFSPWLHIVCLSPSLAHLYKTMYFLFS